LAIHVVNMEFSEGTDVDVEEDFVEIGDIELPDDDPVQCQSELCDELATAVSGRYVDSQNLDSEIPW